MPVHALLLPLPGRASGPPGAGRQLLLPRLPRGLRLPGPVLTTPSSSAPPATTETRRTIPFAMVEEARKHVYDVAIRTPLVRMNWDEGPAEIYLKLENLQPIGSFKIRGAYNAVRLLPAS